MKTQTLCVLYLFISLSSSQRIQDLEPVPVILTGDSQCEHCPNKVSYNCKISNKIIWGVQLARKSTAKNTKPVFGQHTKTSINLDSLGYLITLFIVGKNLTSSQNNLFYRNLHRFITIFCVWATYDLLSAPKLSAACDWSTGTHVSQLSQSQKQTA